MKKTLFCFLLLCSSLSFAANQPLPVDQAFAFNANITQQMLILDWQIAPNYQLYRERIKVGVMQPSSVQLATVHLPPGIPQSDKILGHYQVYRDQLRLTIPLLNYQNSEFRVLLNYQGCSTQGYCYPPQQRILTLQISPFGAQVQSIEKTSLRIQHHENHKLTHKNLFLPLLTFFGFGILLAFTPCVLPMLPILSGIIVGHKRSTSQAFLLSLTYILAMALAYAAAGMIVGLLGKNLQAALQAPWIIIIFSAVFIALALSLFGVYELRLPSDWQNKITLLSQKQRSGSYFGVAIMGALSILIVSPCVSAPLIAALAYISQTGHAAIGGLILFVMGLGIGLPLLIAGTLEGKFLPKTGMWMHTIKIIFGVLLLITAVWLLYRLLPGYICLILWGLIAISSAIYLGVFKFARFNRRTIIWYVILWLWLALGIIFLVGGILKNQDPLHPLHSRQQDSLNFIKIKNLAELQQVLNKVHGKPVLLDFYADWCVSCKIIAQNIFQQKDVQTLLKNVVLLQVDVTADSDAEQMLEKHLHVFAPPTIIFFDRNGNEIKAARIVGEINRHTFISKVKQKVLRQDGILKHVTQHQNNAKST